jgi:tripartite-type tricarboxylate transporter receptor subunit TctC
MSAGAIIAMPLIKSGRLRAVAVTSLVRIPVVPDIPTVSESGVPNFEKYIWHGLLAPKNTSRAIVDRVNTVLNESLKTKDIEERFYAGGIMAAGGTPEVFLAQIKADIAVCRAVAQRLNIKAE